MKAYKGFNPDMTCRGFKYEEGKTYEMPEEDIECCEAGFHACEYPLDVFDYYTPSKSVYREVEAGGKIDKSGGDSKVASSKIKIGAKLTIAGLVKAAISYTSERTKKEEEATGDYGASSATGNRGASSATGDYGASSATGNYGASSATGNHGASSTTGDYGASSATGNCGASSATGNCGASSATGYCGASSATGYCGASSATGDRGASSATGYYGASSATGNCGASVTTGGEGTSSVGKGTGVAVAWGKGSSARGVIGSHLVLSEWSDTDELINAVMIVVDGEKIKENVFYRLVNGEVTENA